jgi:hypothetical protein
MCAGYAAKDFAHRLFDAEASLGGVQLDAIEEKVTRLSVRRQEFEVMFVAQLVYALAHGLSGQPTKYQSGLYRNRVRQSNFRRYHLSEHLSAEVVLRLHSS